MPLSAQAPGVTVGNCYIAVMELVSLSTATILTGLSKRTLWRRIGSGELPRGDSGGKAMIDIAAIADSFMVPAEIELVLQADRGIPEACNDLALLFLDAKRDTEAVYWLRKAAAVDHPDAMHWLGRCFVEGRGVPKDADLGTMWLARSAAHGHAISKAQMAAMRSKLGVAAH